MEKKRCEQNVERQNQITDDLKNKLQEMRQVELQTKYDELLKDYNEL